MKKIISLIAVFSIVFAVPTLPVAEAFDSIYSDVDSDYNWGNANNWDAGVPPGDGTLDVSITANVNTLGGATAWVNSADFSDGVVWDLYGIGLELTVTTGAVFHGFSTTSWSSIITGDGEAVRHHL